MYDVDAVIVGAGVVGLAIGRVLASAGLETYVLEARGRFGKETSSRNSEVIHAGIYYASESLKARLCVAGREQLYYYCRTRSVPYRRMGKIIFASTERQEPMLEAILAQAKANGVEDLLELSPTQAERIEPELACASAILSPSTGIVDSHALMLSMLAELEDCGGRLVCNTQVTRISPLRDGRWTIFLADEPEPIVRARYLVNSAGLGAHALAAATDGFPVDSLPPLHFARGVYYGYSGRMPFEHLIYPVPEVGGLGIHLTFDLAGNARFGPNVEWVDEVDYTIADDPARDAQFGAAAQAIFLKTDRSRLFSSFAGVRPKLSGPSEPAADFLILGPGRHGLPNHVALFGIESPGLTSALAIAEWIGTELDLRMTETATA